MKLSEVAPRVTFSVLLVLFCLVVTGVLLGLVQVASAADYLDSINSTGEQNEVSAQFFFSYFILLRAVF